MTKNPHHGSSFDSFLEEEGLLLEVEAAAVKRVIAWEFEQALAARGLTKAGLAAEMHTSRAALDRLLDPDNTSVTLSTLVNAAIAVDMQLRVNLEARGTARVAALLPVETRPPRPWIPQALIDADLEDARYQKPPLNNERTALAA
jgi:antitoxin HicB